jgi:hypothetical protein
MDKGIGFSRTILVDWLDVTASLCVQNTPPAEIRQHLVETISGTVHGTDAQRKTIDVLSAIWVKTEKSAPQIRQAALAIFPTLSSSEDRLWLHYGMTLVCYPFFRKCVAVIGQISRTEDIVTRKMIKDRIAGDYGHLGALDRSVERIVASLTNWNILSHGEEKNVYGVRMRAIQASAGNLQTWILACALKSHPSDAVPFADLVGLPELFPFRFSITVADLIRDNWFNVYRLGGGLEMVEKSKNS